MQSTSIDPTISDPLSIKTSYLIDIQAKIAISDGTLTSQQGNSETLTFAS
jgi:hypothetical protein